MSSTVLTNQSRDAQPFLSAPIKIDPLTAQAPSSVPSPSTIKRWIRQNTTNTSFSFSSSTFVECYLNPSDSHVSDVQLQFSLGALSSGNYCAYPGITLPTRIVLLSGSEVLHDYSYRQVIKAVLAIMSDEERNTVLAAAGGTAFASGNCNAIIPLFFSRWLAPFTQHMPPFPVHKLEQALKLRVYLDTAANVAASGATAGSPTISGNFIITTNDAETYDESGNFVYQSYDMETQVGQVVATATATDVNCDGFTGQIAALAVTNQLASDLSTAHNYLKSVPIDILKLQIDSDKTYWESDEASTSQLDQIINKISRGAVSASTVSLLPYWIPICVMWNPRAFTGAISMRNVGMLRVNVTHSQGANTQCDIVAFKNAYYKIENQKVKRYLY